MTLAASANVIALGLTEPYQRKLSQAILGSEDASAIAKWVRDLASDQLGWRDPECFHFELSVGAAFGLSQDGERCLLKFPGPDVIREEAIAQSRFQTWLFQRGFPCPDVLVMPMLCGSRVWCAETYLDAGRRADGHVPSDRQLLAAALAHLVDLGREYPDQASIPMRALKAGDYPPWPKPHNALFDFHATRAGAEWIDAAGRDFAPVLASTSEVPVIGHMDWAAKHCRIEAERVSAVYDWDSVARLPEARIVGEAAASFVTSWYVEGANRPTIAELAAFVTDYESARGRAFREAERQLLVASVFYAAGYGARCEHAIASETDQSENRLFLRELLDAGDNLADLIWPNKGHAS